MTTRSASSSPARARLRVLAALACLAVPGLAAQSWSLVVAPGAGHAGARSARAFAADLDGRSGGRLRADVLEAKAPSSGVAVRDAIRTGVVPAGVIALTDLAAEAPVFRLAGIPLLATSYPDAHRLWTVSRAAVETLLSAQGLTVLYAFPGLPRGLLSTTRLAEVKLLRGRRIGVPDAASARLVALAGAVAVPTGAEDATAAIAEGRVDAAFLPPDAALAQRAWDRALHFYDLRAVIPLNLVLVSADALQRLEPAGRAAIQGAARAAGERAWAEGEAAYADAVDAMKTHGLIVHEPAPDLRFPLEALARRLVVDWTEAAGDEGVRIVDAFYALD